MEKDFSDIQQDEAIIYIRDLYKSFGDKHVLSDANLDVFNKENVVILGRSGSGKSVLIKIISGLLLPDSGVLKVSEEQLVQRLVKRGETSGRPDDHNEDIIRARIH